jgi:hypothetical protein
MFQELGRYLRLWAFQVVLSCTDFRKQRALSKIWRRWLVQAGIRKCSGQCWQGWWTSDGESAQHWPNILCFSSSLQFARKYCVYIVLWNHINWRKGRGGIAEACWVCYGCTYRPIFLLRDVSSCPMCYCAVLTPPSPLMMSLHPHLLMATICAADGMTSFISYLPVQEINTSHKSSAIPCNGFTSPSRRWEHGVGGGFLSRKHTFLNTAAELDRVTSFNKV